MGPAVDRRHTAEARTGAAPMEKSTRGQAMSKRSNKRKSRKKSGANHGKRPNT